MPRSARASRCTFGNSQANQQRHRNTAREEPGMTDCTAGAARGWPRRTIGALTIGLAPRTRSSHHFAAGTVANFGIGTLVAALAAAGLASLPAGAQAPYPQRPVMLI